MRRCGMGRENEGPYERLVQTFQGHIMSQWKPGAGVSPSVDRPFHWSVLQLDYGGFTVIVTGD